MQRDPLKAIKDFFSQDEQMKHYKITQKSLSDGYIFMRFLSNIDYSHFDTAQLAKPPQNILISKSKQSPTYKEAKFESAPQQLNLVVKLKNLKVLIRKIKQYFNSQHEKDIKYGDIDIVSLCKNESASQIQKFFELILCVVVNCQYKEDYISKIMELEPSTQQILANLMQQALSTRLYSLQNESKFGLIEQLQLKEQQNNSLYNQINEIQLLNAKLQQKLEEYEKQSFQLQYQKKRIQRFKKYASYESMLSTSQINPSNNELIEGQLNQKQQDQFDYNQQQSFYQYQQFGREPHWHLIQSLKNKIIREQQAHQNQLQDLYGKINQLQEQLSQCAHYQQLFAIYQEKYQQALTYVEKVSQYEKEKNKVAEEIIEKDIIIEQLKFAINDINERLVEVQQEKIDLELLLAKRNKERLNKNIFDQQQRTNDQRINDQRINDQRINDQRINDQRINDQFKNPNLPKLSHKKTSNNRIAQGCLSVQNSYQNSDEAQICQFVSKLSLNIHPFQQDSISQSIQQLKIKIENQLLEIKRLSRKQKQLNKQNIQLKNKLEKMRKIENQNKKLANIIVQLHTRKNQEVQIVVGCLYQTFTQFDFKFHKLIGQKFINQIDQNSETVPTKFSRRSKRMCSAQSSRFNTSRNSFFSEGSTKKYFNNKKDKRNISIKIEKPEQIEEVLQVSVTQQTSKIELNL